MAETRQTTVRFGEIIYQRLIQAAGSSGLTINSVVVVACMEWLERHGALLADDTTNTSKPSNRLRWKIKAPFARAQHRNCSFCGKEEGEVQRLVAGPGVYICDECVTLCNEIIADEAPSEDNTPDDRG
jgi:hypothetical protein